MHLDPDNLAAMIAAMNKRPWIALDADGVLLDYHQAYASAWERAFGETPTVKDPRAYWAIDRYGLRCLEDEALAHFKEQFDASFWSSVPALPGAVQACHMLVEAGYELVCVSALSRQFAAARQRNLLDLGFPIQALVATGADPGPHSPKAQALTRIRPVAFVDDYLPYLRGVDAGVHKALVMREPGGSPNQGPESALADSRHTNLQAFAEWWLSTQPRTS